MSSIQKVAVVATPTVSLLPYVLQELSLHSEVSSVLVTRETTVGIPELPHHAHHHEGGACSHTHKPNVKHMMTDFSDVQLDALLAGKDAVICVFTGSDLRDVTPLVIAAANRAGIKRFIPTEYGLDSSNESLRTLLPPLVTRYDLHQQLEHVRAGRDDVMGWTAIYTGVNLDEALKVDGDFGIDSLWGTITMLDKPDAKAIVTTFVDTARAIVNAVLLPQGPDGWDKANSQTLHVKSFALSLGETADIIDKDELIGEGRKLERYQGELERGRKEAEMRLNMGHLDSGISLMKRVATWDPDAKAFLGWEEDGGKSNELLGLSERRPGESLAETLRDILQGVRKGGSGHGSSCGC